VPRRSVAVRISGQEYRILSDADEGSLQKVANHVDAAMTQIRDRTGTVDSLDVAILTALNLAKELLAMKERPDVEGGASPELDDDRLRSLIELAETAVGAHLADAEATRAGS
jgi:cell division protein ZapA (FtsZ GTPase activity inhibitor)